MRPAAVLHGPVDDQPDAALLMPQLMALRADALPWTARAALQHLSSGANGGQGRGAAASLQSLGQAWRAPRGSIP